MNAKKVWGFRADDEVMGLDQSSGQNLRGCNTRWRFAAYPAVGLGGSPLIVSHMAEPCGQGSVEPGLHS